MNRYVEHRDRCFGITATADSRDAKSCTSSYKPEKMARVVRADF